MALWQPGAADLDNHIRATVMKNGQFAILYDGWMDIDRPEPYKPYGVTRYGEILGYDIYAALGESYDNGLYTSGGMLTEKDKITLTWALINTYRAVGEEVRSVDIEILSQSQHKEKIHEIRGNYWHINSSPLVDHLDGFIEGTYTGDSEPVTLLYISRTEKEEYWKKVQNDMLSDFYPDAYSYDVEHMTLADFCVLVHTLMEMYGEPVIIDQEKYLLLEAYGRELPYHLNQRALDAVEYLMCRGIIESPDMNWNGFVDFETAATILMRVKDPGSRLTFKEIQLTTDVSLLEKGYYPTNVSITKEPIITATQEEFSYTDFGYYDYFIETVTEDSPPEKNPLGIQSLFMDDSQSRITLPHVTGDVNGFANPLNDTRYLGRVKVGDSYFYHVRIPIAAVSFDSRQAIFYLNSPDINDIPSQFAFQGGGGWYYAKDAVMRTFGGERMPLFSRVPFSEGDPTSYVDYERRAKDVPTAETKTAPTKVITSWTLNIPTDIVNNEEVTVFEGKPLKQVTSEGVESGNVKISRGATNTNATISFLVSGVENVESAKAIINIPESAINNRNYLGGDSMGAAPAYAYRNSRYMISIEYLKQIGAVTQFIDLHDGNYYMAARIGTMTPSGMVWQGTNMIDVYFNTEKSTITYGSHMTIFPEDRVLVYKSNTDGYFVDAFAMQGRIQGADILTSEGTTLLQTFTLLDETKYSSVTRYRHSSANTPASATTVKNKFLFAASTYPLANFIVVEDARNGSRVEGGHSLVKAFSFWETGINQLDDAGQVTARAQLLSTLGIEPESASVKVFYQEILPETNIDGDFTIVQTDDGTILLRIYDGLSPSTTIGEYYDEVLEAEYNDPTYITSLRYCTDKRLHDLNYNVLVEGENVTPIVRSPDIVQGEGRKAGYVSLEDKIVGQGGSTSGEVAVTSGKILYAPAAIPALFSDCAVALDWKEDQVLSDDVNVYLGPDAIVLATTIDNSADFEQDSSAYIMHVGYKASSVQMRRFSYTPPDGLLPTSKPPASLIPSEPDAITDWLLWLKEARLEEAEDILTICIIAVLSWLPRLFMAMFMCLMALSLIKEVKPWIIFCDKIFDPYKFLTGGRQTVHTIDLKTTLLWSLVALCLFGFFQNGKILEVIGWLARAVTGILSR